MFVTLVILFLIMQVRQKMVLISNSRYPILQFILSVIKSKQKVHVFCIKVWDNSCFPSR